MSTDQDWIRNEANFGGSGLDWTEKIFFARIAPQIIVIFLNVGLSKILVVEAEHPVCPACRSNFRPRKWLKPIARYLRLNRFDQRSGFLFISNRGIWTFTSGTFIWCSSLWLSRIPCSGTCVTTTLWSDFIDFLNGKSSAETILPFELYPPLPTHITSRSSSNVRT